MNFEELYKTDISKHIEKKGQFSYLSWPYAVAEFRKACPSGTWEIRHFENKPYCVTDAGCFVEITVFPAPDGLGFTQIHPVLDNRNKTLKTPDAFQINTSIQRCLVKAIALATGIGLHIYAGEDLPTEENDTTAPLRKTAPPKKDDRKPPTLTVYKKQAQEAEDVKQWYRDNRATIEADLSEKDLAELIKLCGELSKMINCPIPGAGKTTMEDCVDGECPELGSCKPYQEALVREIA